MCGSHPGEHLSHSKRSALAVIMQQQIPQFIEEENKFLGPLSFRQFFVLLCGAGVIVFIWFIGLVPIYRYLLAGVVGSLTIAIVFLKPGGRPAAAYIASMFRYIFRPHILLWKTQKPAVSPLPEKVGREKGGLAGEAAPQEVPPSRLAELAQSFQVEKEKSDEKDPDTYLT